MTRTIAMGALLAGFLLAGPAAAETFRCGS